MDLFYGKFAYIGGFTFLNLMSWGLSYKLFILKNKVIVANRRMAELEKRSPELKELVAKKRVAMGALKKTASSTPLPELDAHMQEILNKMEVDLANSLFIAAGTYTLADVMATCFLSRIHMIKGTSMSAPNTLDYFKRMQARPSFKDANCIMNFEDTDMHTAYTVFYRNLKIGACVAATGIAAAGGWIYWTYY